MTAYAENRTTTPGWPMFAALGAGTALVLAAVGTFWDLTGNDSGGGTSMREYLIVAAIILVATALVFGLVVRTASESSGGTRALVLAVVGVLSLVVFWSGLPPVLAFGSIGCAMQARAGSFPITAKVALGLSAVTLVLAVAGAIAG